MNQKFKGHLLFLLGSFFMLAVHAQNKKPSISGVVKDSLQKPVMYATVGLYKKSGPEVAVKNTYTNDKGRFSLSAIDSGDYHLVISHTGFAEIKKEVSVAGSDLEVGEVLLMSASGNLQGVTVMAKKPLIEQTDDKIIFNVENDPATKMETAIDILRKTPFVSVDGDNNIQVNGQTNFKVLLNGRETAMFAQNVKEALKGFPGSLITRIEVITSPSAKYDAEGVGGIINIVTKKKVAGYNGSINTYYSTNGWLNGNANLSLKFGKVGVTANYGGGGGNRIPGTNRWEYLPLSRAGFSRISRVGAREMTNFWNFGNAEINWEIDSLNTISSYGNLSGGKNSSKLNQQNTIEYDNSPDRITHLRMHTRYEYPTKSVGTDYIRKFSSNKEREFSIRLNGEFGQANSFLNSYEDYTEETGRYVINNSRAKNKQYTIQSDYIHPFKNNRKLESGVKGIIRRATSNFESFSKQLVKEEFLQDMDNTDYFRYGQDVYSAYTTYSFKVKKTSFRLGGRMEHTKVDGDFRSSDKKVNQSYTSWLPNLQSTTRFSNLYTMVLTYTKRLQRPYIWNLNPFENKVDSFARTYGNPDLAPQNIHSFSMQNRFMKGTTFFGVTLNASYSNDMIVMYATKVGNVIYTTSDNLGKEVQFSVNANVNTKITPEWTVSLNGNVRYNRVTNKAMQNQVNSGIGGNANLNSSYTFNKKFVASGYAGFWRSPVTIQTSYPLNVWYGINMGYKLFKEKLTASVGVSNFLEKERDFKVITRDPAFQITSVSTMPFRAASFSLNWNFGKLSENVSKKKGVSNDDLIGNGQSN